LQPERCDPTIKGYDARNDIWAYGMTLTELALMRFPYNVDRGDFFAVMMAILNSPAPVVPTPQFSPAFADYVAHWFCKRKGRRRRNTS
jgi:serine/threonine protein kinase